MAFELRISFTGLCLFAPDLAGNPPCLHVLLVQHGEHLAKALYDKGHAENPPVRMNSLACVDISEQVITVAPNGPRITQFGHHTDAHRLPEPIVHLQGLSASVPVLPRHFVTNHPNTLSPVAARVSVYSGGYSGIITEGIWQMGSGTPFPMATLLEWTVQIEEDQFILPTTGDDVPLRPFSDGVIELFIFNSLYRDLIPQDPVDCPTYGEEADHFRAYYSFFGPNDYPVPTVAYNPVCRPGVVRPSACKPTRVIDDYTTAIIGPHAARTANTVRCVNGQTTLG